MIIELWETCECVISYPVYLGSCKVMVELLRTWSCWSFDWICSWRSVMASWILSSVIPYKKKPITLSNSTLNDIKSTLQFFACTNVSKFCSHVRKFSYVHKVGVNFCGPPEFYHFTSQCFVDSIFIYMYMMTRG